MSADAFLTKLEEGHAALKPRKRPRVAQRWTSQGKAWKPIAFDDSILLASDEGGFAGLEVLDDVVVYGADTPAAAPLTEATAPASLPVVSTKRKGKNVASRGSTKSNAAAKEGAAAAAAEPAEGVTAAQLQARIAKLEAQNRRLLQAQARTRAAAGGDVSNAQPPQPKRHKAAAAPPHAPAAGGAGVSQLPQAKRGIAPAKAKAAAPPAPLPAAADMSAWAPLGLHPVLEAALAAQGFGTPTPIQAACLPPAMRDRLDIIGAHARALG
jgi:hypothetical protein